MAAARMRAAALAAVLLGSVMARDAAAHYVYDEYYVYESHENCTHVRSETSHGDGGGYRKVRVESSDQLNTWADYDCTAHRVVAPNNIANRALLWKWSAKKARWELCSDPGYYYNPGRASFLTVAMKQYRPTPPCGSGYYGTNGVGYVVYNSTWYGGTVYSGYHLLPAE